MSPIVSLRFLGEPAYILLGGLIPDGGSGPVRVLRSADSVVEYSPEAAEAIRYFSVLRSRDDAIRAIAAWGGDADDLEALVEAGTLVGFPADDEAGVRSVLAELTIVVPAEATLTGDGRTVLLRLPNGRCAAISALTAAVVEASPGGIGIGVRTIARGAGFDEDTVWRSAVHDFTSILMTGAGHLEEVTS